MWHRLFEIFGCEQIKYTLAQNKYTEKKTKKTIETNPFQKEILFLFGALWMIIKSVTFFSLNQMETKRKRANVVMSNSLTANGRRPKKLNEMKTKLNEHSCFVLYFCWARIWKRGVWHGCYKSRYYQLNSLGRFHKMGLKIGIWNHQNECFFFGNCWAKV